MDVFSTIQTLKQATSSAPALSQTEQSQLLSACSDFLEVAMPIERKIMDWLFSPLKAIAIRLAIDMKVFDVATSDKYAKEGISLEQLSHETSCEALLLKRFLRILVAEKLFTELSQDVFLATKGAFAYRTESPLAQIIIHFTSHLQQLVSLPSFFSEKGYKSPTDARDTAFQYVNNTQLHAFEHIAADARQQHAFNVTMTIRTQRSMDSPWFEIYPIRDLLSRTSPEEVMLVDIGGGIGHLSIDLKTHHPDAGKIVVQDLPAVLSAIKDLPGGIEAQPTDFFCEQPVKGAKAYLLAHCLHDWPDAESKVILGHIRDAMAEDSVLLISEAIMPEQGVDFMTAAMDLTMMAAFASLERTEAQFKALLEGVGLELVKIWEGEGKGKGRLGTSVVEARLKR